MGVIGMKIRFSCLFEGEYEVATEKIVVDSELVLQRNGLGGVRFRERQRQLHERAAGFPVAGADFDSGRFGAALAVAESGACHERNVLPRGFYASLPFGAVAVFAGFEAGRAEA